MKNITVHNLSIQFDADQITKGGNLDQAQQALGLINGVLQRQPYGLAAQVIYNDNVEIEIEIGDDYEGEACPKCESDEIVAKNFEPSGPTTAYRGCHCETCGHEWTEKFQCVGQDPVE